jgi:hypothetical protein
VPSNKNNGSARVSQSVFETNYEYYSPSDLTLFQKQYGLTVQAAVGERVSLCFVLLDH